MSQSKTAIDNLLTWAKSNGTSLHSEVDIFEDPDTGLSFKATADLPHGTDVVCCSYKVTLSYLNSLQLFPAFGIHSSQPFPAGFIDALTVEDPNVIGHFFLMQQYLIGEKSFWWPYIRLLPQPDEPDRLSIPIWWSEQDRKFLAGTNAEPPISTRAELWEDEWTRGVALLKDKLDDYDKYTYHLYQWAATIFGTRSFRASLTIPEEFIEAAGIAQDRKSLTLDHITNDHFSVLLPVLDIGNHNGVNNATWSMDPGAGHFGFNLINSVERNSQIFNYYGDKSNSELLVGYGFTLPGAEHDSYQIKLTPGAETIARRGSRTNHLPIRAGFGSEQYMFQFRGQPQKRLGKTDESLIELELFSEGLLSLVADMMANEREQGFMDRYPDYSLEQDSDVFHNGPMARSILLALQLIARKLESDAKRINRITASLPEPQNQKQSLALDYRSRQMNVIKAALQPIKRRLEVANCFGSFCSHAHGTILFLEDSHLSSMQEKVELLSLECAYDWLRIHFPDVHEGVTKIIAEDQHEPLPLNWSILEEDWAHTYWTVWIYLLWLLYCKDGFDFRIGHGFLSTWLLEMRMAYMESIKHTTEIAHADASERETITHTIDEILKLPQFVHVWEKLQSPTAISWKGSRKFSSVVAHEETIYAGPDTHRTKKLVITKRWNPIARG